MDMFRITLFQKPPCLPPLPVSLLTEVVYTLGCGRKDGNSGDSQGLCSQVSGQRYLSISLVSDTQAHKEGMA